jgi:hypothetical protein
MPIASYDALLTALSEGQKEYLLSNKITGGSAYVAGRWYDFSNLNGSPVANTFPGTALAWRSCNESTGNGTDIFGIRHGGDVEAGGVTKHIINYGALTNVATGVPGLLMLVDMQGYYPGINMNVNTAQTLTGTPTLRYANGAGIRAFLVARATTGATAHNIAYSYTNQAGTAGRVNPVTVSATASAIVGHIVHSGTAANNYAPFLPMASGDTGIQSFQSVTLSAASGTASTAALVLVKPLLSLPISAAGVAAERDLVNQFPSLPRVRDGACLTWLYFAGAATAAATSFTMWGDVAWSA